MIINSWNYYQKYTLPLNNPTYRQEHTTMMMREKRNMATRAELTATITANRSARERQKQFKRLEIFPTWSMSETKNACQNVHCMGKQKWRKSEELATKECTSKCKYAWGERVKEVGNQRLKNARQNEARAKKWWKVKESAPKRKYSWGKKWAINW